MAINRRDFLKTGAYVAASVTSARAQHSSSARYQIGAYYFPDFHPDPRSEQLHGKGWTEWELLKRAEPKFPGHHQPKKPLWGAKDESDPAVFQQKIDAAARAGIGCFIFDWYWYDGAPFLQRALEEGYLGAPDNNRIKFCLMWANHDWIDLMPARLREQCSPLVFKGTYDADAFAKVTDYIISHYFSRPSYFTIDGAPYLSIYELKNLIDKMGGLETAKAAIDRFRRRVKSAGFPDVHLNAVAWGLSGYQDPRPVIRELGVNSVTSYTWAHYCRMADFPASSYEDMVGQAESYWHKASEMFGVPYHTDISMGWDPSPRACQSDRYEKSAYPFTPILRGNTPEAFEAALVKAKHHMDSHLTGNNLLTINSWNEWTEGSHLEPEALHGERYLDVLRKVFFE